MHVIFVLWLCTQASSEHPLAKAILDYALHFHFFGKLPSSKDGIEQRKDKVLSQWLLEAEDFSAVPSISLLIYIVWAVVYGMLWYLPIFLQNTPSIPNCKSF
jgi:hypothetical protein